MKFAITSQGPDLDSPVDPRFGRARFFHVIDSDAGAQAVISNETNVNAVQGAGLQVAQTLVNQGVQAVVTGHVGPKAFAGLRSANLTIYTGAEGTVRQALEAFQAGRLRALSQADVQGHW